jgi:hypothetical protein
VWDKWLCHCGVYVKKCRIYVLLLFKVSSYSERKCCKRGVCVRAGARVREREGRERGNRGREREGGMKLTVEI